MPFDKSVSDESAAKLDEIAAVMDLPRSVMVTVAEDTGWKATDESCATHDLVNRPEDIEASIVELPRIVASVFLRTGADHIAGFGALLRQRECWSGPGVLARAAFEHGVRACWVLDSSASSSQRSARALLEELATVDFSRKAISGVAGKDNDGYRTMNARRKVIVEWMKKTFTDVDLSGSQYDWTLNGEQYPRITRAAEHWGNLRRETVSAEAIYDGLSFWGHPQSLAARYDVQWSAEEPTGSYVYADVPLLARQASAALAAWYDGFLMLMSYHGLKHTALDEIENGSDLLARHSERASQPEDRPE